VWVSGVKDSRWFVAIGGFRVNVVKEARALVKMVSDAASPHPAQIVDAAKVAGRDHLFLAAVNAVKSTETGVAVSKNITVEALLYASAQDQITRALEMLGVTGKSTSVALMIFAPSKAEAEDAYRKAAAHLGEEDDKVLELTEGKVASLKRTYGVSEEELKSAGGPSALGGLIVERGALLSLRR
jgi:tRNA threonylcarbamoyladenosine modification (KEOPS) complex Cgi121 subunit